MQSKWNHQSRTAALAVALCLAGVSMNAVGAEPSSRQNPDWPVLSLTIRCTNTPLKAGDEIPIEFIVKNEGAKDYQHSNRTYDRGGRLDIFSLVATNAVGEQVPDPRANDRIPRIGGGLSFPGVLRPGESFSRIIALNRWALVKEAGTYVVSGTYAEHFGVPNSPRIKSPPITVVVHPRSAPEMDAYIDVLTNRVGKRLAQISKIDTSQLPDPDLQDAVMRLMYTCSPKIVPCLLQSMLESAGKSGFWEEEAILFYVPRTPEIRSLIEEMAHGRGAESSFRFVLQNYELPKAKTP